MTDLLASFDEDVLRAVASENDVELTRLRETLADHQRTMRDNPRVADIVYERHRTIQRSSSVVPTDRKWRLRSNSNRIKKAKFSFWKNIFLEAKF